MENIENETWHSIKGYEDFYAISDMGRFRSFDRVSCGRFYEGRIYSPGKTTGGHLKVRLSREGKYVDTYIHHLVAAAFIGPRPQGYDICHNDGNPENNRVDNLRYDTRAGNCADKIRHGTNRGGGCRVLTPDLVRQIRSDLAAGHNGARLARKYCVTPPTISNIKTGRSWSYVD